MKRTLITVQTWVLSFALAWVLFGCAKDSDDSVDADKSVYITVKMPADNNGVSTRAGAGTGAVDEVAIK